MELSPTALKTTEETPMGNNIDKEIEMSNHKDAFRNKTRAESLVLDGPFVPLAHSQMLVPTLLKGIVHITRWSAIFSMKVF